MSSDKEVSPEKVLEGLEKIADKLNSVNDVTEFGLQNKVTISKTEAEAKDRAEYENFMKNSEIKENAKMEETIDNVFNNIVDDLFDGYL
jgi:hypothetical protein